MSDDNRLKVLEKIVGHSSGMKDSRFWGVMGYWGIGCAEFGIATTFGVEQGAWLG